MRSCLLFVLVLLALAVPMGAISRIVKATEGQSVCFDTGGEESSAPVSWTRRGTWNSGERYIFRCPSLAEHFKCNLWTDWLNDFDSPTTLLHANGSLCMESVTRSDSGLYFPTYGASKVLSTPHAVSILPQDSFRLIVTRSFVPFEIGEHFDDKMRFGRFAQGRRFVD